MRADGCMVNIIFMVERIYEQLEGSTEARVHSWVVKKLSGLSWTAVIAVISLFIVEERRIWNRKTGA